MDEVKKYYQKEMDMKRDFYKGRKDSHRPLPQNLLLKNLISKLPRAGACLDLGCSVGSTLSLIGDRFEEVYGIDIIETPEIREKPYIHFKGIDINNESLPFKEGKFDTIICSMIFEHIFNPFKLMSEITRCLKKNGFLVIGVPNICYFKHIISLCFGRVPRTAEKISNFSESEAWDGQHLHSFSINDVKDMLLKFRFIIKSMDTSGRFSKLRRIWPSFLFSDIYIVAQKVK